MVEAARWRVGRFRLNAALELTNAGYDTDIYYGYLVEPAPDYTFSIGLPLQVLLPLGKKAVIELNENPQYVFYLSNENERAWNHAFRSQFHIALSRVYIQGGAGLSNIRQRLSPELNINVREKENSLNGAILWQASQSISFALIGDARRYDYGDVEFGGTSLADTLNRLESFADLVTYFQPSPRVRFFLDGQYGNYVFSEVTSSFADTHSYGLFAGLAFLPREGEERPVDPIQGSISLGYKFFDVLDPQQEGASGFVGAIDISAGLFVRTRGRAFFSRDFSFSAYSPGTYYLSTTFGGGIIRRLSRRAAFSYDILFNWGRYPTISDSDVPSGQDFRYMTHNFDLNVRLSRELGITFIAIFNQRDSSVPGLSTNRNFFGFALTYGRPSVSISAPRRGLSG